MPNDTNTTRWRLYPDSKTRWQGHPDYSFVLPAAFALAHLAFANCESRAFAAAFILRLPFLTGAAALTGLADACALRFAQAAFILAEALALAAALIGLALG